MASHGPQLCPVMTKLRATLTGIQAGEIEDKFDWVHKIA